MIEQKLHKRILDLISYIWKYIVWITREEETQFPLTIDFSLPDTSSLELDEGVFFTSAFETPSFVIGGENMATVGSSSSTTRDNKEVKITAGDEVEVIKSNPLGMGKIEIGYRGVVVSTQERDKTVIVSIPILGESIQWLCPPEILRIVTTEDARMERKVADTVEAYMYLQDMRVNDIRSEKDKINIELDILSMEMRNKYSTIRELEKVIKLDISTIRNVNNREKSGNLIKYLYEQAYEDIVVSSGYKLTAYTKPVTVYHFLTNKATERTLIKLGQYKVVISFKDLKIHSMDNKREHYDHPHINNGSPCLGGWGNSINASLGNADYLEALEKIWNYLHAIDAGGWFYPIQFWLPKEKQIEVCPNCQEEMEDCSCDRCNNCDRISDDCECARCPQTGDIIYNLAEYCSEVMDCEYYDRDSGTCEN